MDSLPGRKGKPMADSVHLGSESIDDDSIERIKAEEEELLKKLKDTDSEKKNIETSLKLRRERLINKLNYDVEDLQKNLAEMKLDNDRLTKELTEQKDVLRFSFKEKQQLVEDLEGRNRTLEKELEKKRAPEKAAASGDNPKLDDVIRTINKFLVAEDSVVPRSLQHPELEDILKNIAKLKDEKNRVAQLYESQNTMVGTQEEKIKSMDKRMKEQCTVMKEMDKKFNDHFHQLEQDNMKLKQSNGQLEANVNQTKAEIHQIRCYAEEVHSNATRQDQKLRKSREEVESFKQQLVQQAEDNARQKQKLSEEMHRLHLDNKQLKYRAQESVGASGDKDKSQDVIRLIHKFLVAEDSVVPRSLQNPELAVILKNIAKLKDEKNRVAQLIETQNTMVGTQEGKIKAQEETIKSMDKSIKDQRTGMAELEKNFNDHFHQLAQENMKLDLKLRKSREEVEGLKQQLAKQAEENARQKPKTR